MSKKISSKASIMFVISNLIAGVLFLIGGIRFHYGDDLVGVIIYVTAAGLFFVLAFGAYLSYRKKSAIEKTEAHSQKKK